MLLLNSKRRRWLLTVAAAPLLLLVAHRPSPAGASSTIFAAAATAEETKTEESEVCSGDVIDGTCLDDEEVGSSDSEDDDYEEEEEDSSSSDDDDVEWFKVDDTPVTCSSYLNPSLKHHHLVAEVRSHYQRIAFNENPSGDDKCMNLDGILQICSSYRPQYHEPFVHFTAAYLSQHAHQASKVDDEEGGGEGMKRVAFVGGGDSMLLHEILKYPSVELILGLELDQAVVRSSFQQFRTQPHFDLPKVQWWFGSATESLNLLPREYFGTFDLVLVDLSETVMSFPVTSQLDILGALALLLKPTGIFVKNELLYYEKLRGMFDYAAQLYVKDNPVICDQDFAVGSDKVDFLRPNYDLLRNGGVDGEEIETLLLKPLVEEGDQFDLIRHYSHRDSSATKSKKSNTCGAQKQAYLDESLGSNATTEKSRQIEEESASQASGDEEKPSDKPPAGILLLVEAESSSSIGRLVLSGPSLQTTLTNAIAQAGLTPVRTVQRPYMGEDVHAFVVVMKEGYVALHMWTEFEYGALDVNLWGGFDKQEVVRDKLLKLLGCGDDDVGKEGNEKGAPWSSYRIVVGGMLGTNTEEKDRDTVGPPPQISDRNEVEPEQDCSASTGACQDTSSKKASEEKQSPIDESTVAIAIEESLTLVLDKRAVVVLCGERETGACAGVEIARKDGTTQNVVALWSCPPSEGSQEEEGSPSKGEEEGVTVTHILLCDDDTNKDALTVLQSLLRQYDGIDALIIDASAPRSSVAQMTNIWRNEDDRTLLRKRPFVVVVPLLFSIDASGAGGGGVIGGVVDPIRLKFVKAETLTGMEFPVRTIEIALTKDDEGNHRSGKLGLITSGSHLLLKKLVHVADAIQSKSGALVDITDIESTPVPFQHKYDPDTYTMDQYDAAPGLDQFVHQRPVGYQSIVQLSITKADDVSEEDSLDLDSQGVKDAMKKALPHLTFQEVNDVGSGLVLVALESNGHVIVTWDGHHRIDLNLFTYYSRQKNDDHKTHIVDRVLDELTPAMEITLFDEMPRGFNRVVNFMEDIDASPGCADGYAMCVQWAGAGKCEGSSWMEEHCPRSCGGCQADLWRDTFLPPTCSDAFVISCDEWKEEDQCEENEAWMEMYCKKACGWC